MSQPRPDFQSFLALPACYDPTMSAADWQVEIERMVRSSLLTRDFVMGEISPSDFSDGLADLDHNPYALGEFWDAGISLR